MFTSDGPCQGRWGRPVGSVFVTLLWGREDGAASMAKRFGKERWCSGLAGTGFLLLLLVLGLWSVSHWHWVADLTPMAALAGRTRAQAGYRMSSIPILYKSTSKKGFSRGFDLKPVLTRQCVAMAGCP